jgi:hypothetical protein
MRGQRGELLEQGSRSYSMPPPNGKSIYVQKMPRRSLHHRKVFSLACAPVFFQES